MRILGLPSLLRSLNFNPFPHARYTYRYSSFLSPPILKLCKYVSGYQGIEFRTDRHHTNHRGYFFTRLKKLSPDKWFCSRFHKGVPGRTVIRSQGFFGNKSRFVCLFFLLPHTMPLRSYVFVCVRVCVSVCTYVTKTPTCRKHARSICSLTSGSSAMTRISGSWKVSAGGGWNKQEKPLWRCEWKSTEALPPSAHSSALQLCLPASQPAPDRLLHGQVYRGRCGEEGEKMQAQHANQVFPLLALGSKDS